MSTIHVGPASKYQPTAEEIQKRFDADVVIVIVKGGKVGSGMAFAVVPQRAPELLSPSSHSNYLRALADSIDLIGGKGISITRRD